MRIIILFIILFNYQAGAQSLPDNFNLIPTFDNEKSNFSNSIFENACWIRANNYGVKFIPTGIYTLDTINQSNRMTPIISKYLYLTFPTYFRKYDNINKTNLDTFANQRWYAQTKLIKKLELNKRYYFSVFVNCRIDSGIIGNESLYGFLPNLGFYFSENASYDTFNTGQLLLNPQFKITNLRAKGPRVNTYRKYEYSFKATGKEQYLIIGNFDYFKNFDTLFSCKNCYQLKNDTITDMQAIIGIDGLVLTADTSIASVVPPEFNIGNDTTVCKIDSFRLYAPPYYQNYYWQDGQTTNSILATNSGKYYCTADLGCGIYTDTVNINFCTTPNLETIFVPNAFSPNNDNKNDLFSILESKIIPIRLIITNRYGEVVYNTKSNFSWDGYFKGNLCNLGIYYYSLTYQLKNSKEIIIKNGDITLLK
jgi:gliding motility-associated-like protein